MRKKLFALLLTLVLAIGLCPLTLAAEAAPSPFYFGCRGDWLDMSWRVTTSGRLLLLRNRPLLEEEQIFAACYDGQGRYLDAKVFTADRLSAQLDPRTSALKFLWLGQDCVPQSAPATAVQSEALTIHLEPYDATTQFEWANLQGCVSPAAGASLTLDGQSVELDAYGAFSTSMPLAPGYNPFTLTATNAKGETDAYTASIRRVDPDTLPQGYVFVYNNVWEENPDIVDTYLVNVVDPEGVKTTMSVNEDIKEAISADSSKALEWAGNTYVGKFLLPTVDESGVVTALEPAEQAPAGIAALGNGTVQATGDSAYGYDSLTKFVYVDLGVDDKDLIDHPEDDVYTFSGCGEFDPDRFYNAEEIDSTHVPGVDPVKDAAAPFASVKMTVVSQDGITADYVYVVRICW